MAVEVYRHDSLPSTTGSTRDGIPGASVTSNSGRVSGGVQSTQDGSRTTSTFGSSLKKRRLSKPKAGRALPRSISTPHLPGHMMSDSDADKKRNKLGYQRISIACAHCRRRKIRCLVADGDPQSRCQNCIRLKKECVFYPVEQQSAIENKSQSSIAGGGTEASSTVSSSPPEIGVGRPFDERRETGGFATLPSNAPSSFQGVPLEPGSALSSQGSFPRPEYGYPHQPGTPWDAPNEFAPNASPVQHDHVQHLNHNFLRYNHAVSPGDVSPFYPDSMQAPPETHVTQPYHYQQERADSFWQQHQHPPPPVRSMSYDQVGSMQTNDPYAVGYQTCPPQHYSQMRHGPLSVEMQAPNIMTEPSGPHSAPIRDHHYAFTDQSRPYMLPPEVQAMHRAGARPEYANHWYQAAPQYVPGSGDASAPHDLSNYTNQDDRPG